MTVAINKKSVVSVNSDLKKDSQRKTSRYTLYRM